MSTDLKELITLFSDIKFGGREMVFEFKFRDFLEEDLSPKHINFLEQLTQCTEDDFNFLLSQGRVDIDWETWRKKLSKDINYIGVAPASRNQHKWTSILKDS